MKKETRERIKLNRKPQPKLSMVTPPTKLLASKTVIVLITNRKRPRVNMVKGKVRIISIGLTIIFRIARTRAKIIAV